MPATAYPYGIGAPGLPMCIATAPMALPQGTTGTIFTITGAPIKVVRLHGVCTTTIGSVANATKLQAVPATTPTTAIDLCATSDLNAFAAGGLINCITGFSTALDISVTSGVGPVASATLFTTFFMRAGVIRVNCAGSSVTGAVQWYLVFEPYPNWSANNQSGNPPYPTSVVTAAT